MVDRVALGVAPQERVHIDGFARFSSVSGSNYLNIGFDGNSKINSYGSGILKINYDSPQNVNICTGSPRGKVITGGDTYLAAISGKVGIGTLTPQTKLQIDHNETKGGINLNRTSTATGHSEIKFYQNGTQSENQKWAIGNDLGETGLNNFFIWNHTHFLAGLNGAAFIIDEQNNITIDGAVGININPGSLSPRDPNYKLYVEGNIAAREIKVTVNRFPDYVYTENYKLMSIPNLADFIKIHHHLPGIPTAKEVSENNGFELGQMQISILEKVEEQALYIIDLQKQIDEMKKEFKKLKE